MLSHSLGDTHGDREGRDLGWSVNSAPTATSPQQALEAGPRAAPHCHQDGTEPALKARFWDGKLKGLFAFHKLFFTLDILLEYLKLTLIFKALTSQHFESLDL